MKVVSCIHQEGFRQPQSLPRRSTTRQPTPDCYCYRARERWVETKMHTAAPTFPPRAVLAAIRNAVAYATPCRAMPCQLAWSPFRAPFRSRSLMKPFAQSSLVLDAVRRKDAAQ